MFDIATTLCVKDYINHSTIYFHKLTINFISTLYLSLHVCHITIHSINALYPLCLCLLLISANRVSNATCNAMQWPVIILFWSLYFYNLISWCSQVLSLLVPLTPMIDNKHFTKSIQQGKFQTSGVKQKFYQRTKVAQRTTLLTIGQSQTCVRSQSRDSGNDFRILEIMSDNSRFLFNLFLYPHVVPSRFSKRMSFFGTDYRFWSWLGLTRNENVKSRIKLSAKHYSSETRSFMAIYWLDFTANVIY